MNTKVEIIPSTNQALADLINEVLQVSGPSSLSSIARTTFGDLEKSLRESVFRLAILGPWNSGKSSLINRIIGEEDPENALLPVKDEPTTAKLTYLRFGDSPELKRVGEYGGDPVLLARGEESVRVMIKDEAVKQDRSSLSISWPWDFCRAGGELVDTPGLFDPDEERSMVTLDALEKFHAVIFVVPAPMPVNKEILQFIEEHFVKRTHAKFFFLINKIDWLKGKDTTVDQFLDQCHTELSDALASRYEQLNLKGKDVPDVTHLLKRERFFGVSATYGNGIEEAATAIREFLAEGSRELVEVAILKINFVLESLEKAIAQEQQARQIEQGSLDQPYEELVYIERKFQQHMEETKKSLPKDMDRAVQETAGKIRELLRRLYKDGTDKLNYSFWKKITKPNQIQREIAALQRGLVEGTEDAMHNIQKKLGQEIRKILENYQNDLVGPTINELKIVAARVDKALAEYDASAPVETDLKGRRGLSDKQEMPDDNGSFKVAGAGLVGAGTGAAVAFGTGAAYTTTTTVVSTAASWVPLWVAQTLGMTTTVGTPVLATGALTTFIAGPAAAALIVCLAILNRMKSLKSIKACQDFLDELRNKYVKDVVKSLEGEIEKIASNCVEGMDSYVGGIIVRLRDYIEHLKTTSLQVETPAEITRIADGITLWRESLASIKENCKPSAFHGNTDPS